jgi:tellurite methyltransferase
MKYSEENYKRFYGRVVDVSSYGQPVEIVRRIPQLLAGGTVLDLGAGDGRHALYLAAERFAVKAVDISQAGLDKLERLARESQLTLKTLLADLSQWSIDAEYDVILSILLVQHLEPASALRLMQETKERTKPGGVNAIELFTCTGDRPALSREEDPDFHAFYPEDGWLRSFYRGWEILSHESSSAPLIGKTRTDGSPMSSVVERLVARKPNAH